MTTGQPCPPIISTLRQPDALSARPMPSKDFTGSFVTKSKTVFPTDDNLLKMLYLAVMDITKKWAGHRQDWGQIHSRLEIYFEDRLSGKNL